MTFKKRDPDKDFEAACKWLEGVGRSYYKLVKEYFIDPFYTPEKKK